MTALVFSIASTQRRGFKTTTDSGGVAGGLAHKPEYRNTKSETNPKHEIRKREQGLRRRMFGIAPVI
jgi:hypothetical protein